MSGREVLAICSDRDDIESYTHPSAGKAISFWKKDDVRGMDSWCRWSQRPRKRWAALPAFRELSGLEKRWEGMKRSVLLDPWTTGTSEQIANSKMQQASRRGWRLERSCWLLLESSQGRACAGCVPWGNSCPISAFCGARPHCVMKLRGLQAPRALVIHVHLGTALFSDKRAFPHAAQNGSQHRRKCHLAGVGSPGHAKEGGQA